MAATEATVISPIEDWKDVPWRTLEKRIFRLQKRIYRAQSRGNEKAVRSLQRLLIKSWSARMLAVRRVTQENQGKRTAGIDGIKNVGPQHRLALVTTLAQPEAIKARPVRRVLIPKPGKEGQVRRLGIPVMLDRAHQALIKLALEPQWEARFEPNSYGFRPGRSCHDAIEAVFNQLRFQDKYILDADIADCFDSIRQEVLLAKLAAPRVIQRARPFSSAMTLYMRQWPRLRRTTPTAGEAAQCPSSASVGASRHGRRTPGRPCRPFKPRLTSI